MAKNIPALLLEGVENGTLATCVKLTTTNGDVKAFTNHDIELVVDAVTYKPTPGLERITMNLRDNAEVSNQEFAGGWVVDLNEQDMFAGVYDEATIEVFKVDWSNVVAGKIIVEIGTIGMVQWSDQGFRADSQSQMRKAAALLGVIVTAKCRHQLFAPNSSTSIGGCQVNSAGFTDNGSVATITVQNLELTAAIVGTKADQYYSNGILTFTSGFNNGLSFEVKTATTSGNVITLFLPTPYLISVSDTFTVNAGCDKNIETCRDKFNNHTNFGGFPHITGEQNFK